MGELHACGRAPDVVVLESCARAKVGGPLVMGAMLAAERLEVVQCVAPSTEVAVERLRARDHSGDGKGVQGQAPENVHARFAAEVVELRQELVRRAQQAGVSSPRWRVVTAEVARALVTELVQH